MKLRLLGLAGILAVLAGGATHHSQVPEPTVLSFRIGQTFEEVVNNSTYPVMKRSRIPTNAHLQAGATWVTEPAVILRFDDSKHGFTLPPTKFASLFFMENRVQTLATTPMIEKLPFEQALVVLANLQSQFQAGGWEPYAGDDSRWFDLSPEGKKRLYARMFVPGYMETQRLRIPNKYSMTFRLWCAAGCATHEPPYLFLIDVGMSSDVYSYGGALEPESLDAISAGGGVE